MGSLFANEPMIGVKVSDDVATASFVGRNRWIFRRPFKRVAREVIIMPDKALDLIRIVWKKMHDRRFRQRSKERPTDFTRPRKVDFVGVVPIIYLASDELSKGSGMTF